jgi:hypothetical protein
MITAVRTVLRVAAMRSRFTGSSPSVASTWSPMMPEAEPTNESIETDKYC